MKTFQIYKLFCSVFYQGFFTRCAVIISVSDDGWDGNPGPGIQRYFLVLKTWMLDSLEIKSITMHNDLQLRCCQFPAEFMQHKRNSRIWFRILIFSGQWSGVGLMCMLEHWPSKYELPYCSQAQYLTENFVLKNPVGNYFCVVVLFTWSLVCEDGQIVSATNMFALLLLNLIQISCVLFAIVSFQQQPKTLKTTNFWHFDDIGISSSWPCFDIWEPLDCFYSSGEGQ